MYVAYGAVQFATYRAVAHGLSTTFEEHKLPASVESFIAGASAGAVGTTVTYPLDLLRTRFAAQGNQKVYTSLLSSVKDIAKHEGPKGFFRGLGAGVGQIVPHMGIFFATYEALRLPMAGLNLPWSSGDALAGVTASVIAKTTIFPLDLVRKRLQVQGPTRSMYINKNIPVYKGVFSTMGTIVKTEGVRGLYRGLIVRYVSCFVQAVRSANINSLFKAAPASAVTVYTYERVLHALIAMEEQNEEL